MKTELNKGVELNIDYKGSRFEKINGVLIEQTKWDELKRKGILSEERKDGVEDWQETFPPNNWGEKYSKYMYSNTLDRLRFPDMMEFYGNGIVD